MLLTDFPSSCKNSAVFVEINGLADAVPLVHTLQSGETFTKSLKSYFADHRYPYSVNLNQAVKQQNVFPTVHQHMKRRLECAEALVSQICRSLSAFDDSYVAEDKKKKNPSICLFAFRKVLFISNVSNMWFFKDSSFKRSTGTEKSYFLNSTGRGIQIC